MDTSPDLLATFATMNIDGSPEDSPRFPVEKNKSRYWSDGQRKLLFCLNRWHLVRCGEVVRELSAQELRDIFLFAFHDEIPASGSLRRATSGAINSQLRQILRDRKPKEIWQQVYRRTRFRDPFELCAKEMTMIHQAGFYLELDLVFRARDNSSEAAEGPLKLKFENELSQLCYPISHARDPKLSWNHISRLPNVAVLIPSAYDDQTSSSTDSLDGIEYNSEHQSSRSRITSNSSTDFLSKLELKASGQIGWRYYSTDPNNTHGIRNSDGFRALAYAGCPVPKTENDFNSMKLIAALHLTPIRQPSHFISVFKGLRPALNRAMRSSSCGARVAMIDVGYLIRYRLHNHPRCFQGSTVKKMFGITGWDWDKMQTSEYRYTHEYLIFGSIEKEAIIADFSIAELRRFAVQRPLLGQILSLDVLSAAKDATACSQALWSAKAVGTNQSIGQEIGIFLGWVGVRRDKLRSVANQIAGAWNFAGRTSQQEGTKADRGVYLQHVEERYDAFLGVGKGSSNSDLDKDSDFRHEVPNPISRPRSSSNSTLIGDVEPSHPAPQAENALSPVCVGTASFNNPTFNRSDADSDDDTNSSVLDTPSKIVQPRRRIDLKDFKYIPITPDSIPIKRKPANQVLPTTKRRCFDAPPAITFHAINKEGAADEHGIIRQLNKGPSKNQEAGKKRPSQAITMGDGSSESSSPKPIPKGKRSSQLGTTSRRSVKIAIARFDVLQLRSSYLHPQAVDSDKDMASDHSEVDLILTPTSAKSPVSATPLHFSSSPPHLESYVQSEVTETPLPRIELDDFMARRSEVDKALGPLAETRAEEWKGWKDDWKARGVK